jgi:hypothetical protein
MSREIKINRYKGNTHYSIYVIDSYGTEHHLGYERELNNDILAEIEQKASDIWANEVEPKEDLMANAIKWCADNSPHFTDSRGNHRDGLD